MARPREIYHEGERAAQRAAGEEDAALQNGTLIADAFMAGAGPFLRAQRMLVVASRDAQGRPWASIVFGAPGFVSAGDGGRSLIINRATTYASDIDLLWSHLPVGAPLGLLLIELSSRRRLRVNGRVETLGDDRIVLRVEQAYPNCPKYIQQRRLRRLTPRAAAGLLAAGESQPASAALVSAVSEADTIFVASGHPSRGLDASHRGGQPGFIEFYPPDSFRIPDYAGNGMFNTLGNLLVDPRCGLTVFDFQRGRLHQVTGAAGVHFDPTGASDDPALTGRFWEVRVHAWRSAELPVQADWEFVGYSPYNPSGPRLERTP